jgi:hydroxymethylglutaryl-CoA lyase
VHKISIPVSVSDGHSMANLNRTPAQSIEMMREIMAWLGAQPRKVPVVAGCSTAFGCSIDGVVPTAKAVALAKGLADAGVDQIMLADTVGYAHPAQIKEVVRATRDAIGDKLYGLHLHDTCGLGIANALAGLEEGIRAFDSCLAGLGGCPYAPGASGNVVTEDLVFMLESMGFATGIDLPKLLDARRLLHEGLPAEPMHGQVPKAGRRVPGTPTSRSGSATMPSPTAASPMSLRSCGGMPAGWT